jgi:hypothetical protein
MDTNQKLKALLTVLKDNKNKTILAVHAIGKKPLKDKSIGQILLFLL